MDISFFQKSLELLYSSNSNSKKELENILIKQRKICSTKSLRGFGQNGVTKVEQNVKKVESEKIVKSNEEKSSVKKIESEKIIKSNGVNELKRKTNNINLKERPKKILKKVSVQK
eukprot:EC822545.1.p1 GENE.EC822545.1~~EC822545.1.p1  ORF type:complete len:115 (+),score=45.82 EC822545.1:78-422(+)